MRVFCNAISRALIGVVVCTTMAKAQTLFTVPDTTPDYSQYQNVEECVAAMQRIQRRLNEQKPFWPDTMAEAERKQSLLNPIPDEVLAVGRPCLASFTVDSMPVNETEFWAKTLLLVGRDDEAGELFFRQYPSLPDTGRIRLFAEQIRVYQDARPVRYERIQSLFDIAEEQIPPDSTVWRIGLASLLMRAADAVGDEAGRNAVAAKVIAIADATRDEMAGETGMVAYIREFNVYNAGNLLHKEELRDSLTKGTGPYLRLLEANWIRGTTRPFAVNNLPVGKTAPPIVADYWYRRVPSTDGDGRDGTVRHIEATTSPVPHQANLLVFLHGGCHNSTLMPQKGQRPNPTDNCWPTYANIRRLVNEFPSLAVTILVNTHGAIGNSPPLPPAAEADTLAKLFLDYHRLPATLAVVERPFFRIPGADRRRIDTETQNEVNYGFGTPGTFANFGHALLIDQDGVIVKNIDMKRDSMLKIRGLIEALIRRGKTK